MSFLVPQNQIFKTGSMTNFLRSQLLNLRSYSVKKSSSKMKVMAGLFFMASLFCSKQTFAGPCLNGATITSTATSICTGDSVLFTATADTTSISPFGPWSATYQWQASTAGAGGPWAHVGAPGVITPGSPVATYNTSGLLANVWYRVVLTGIIGDCTLGSTTYTSNVIGVTISPRPAPITGVNNFCSGAISCLTDATPGGTWSSDNTAVATVNSSGCVTGIIAGTANIIYVASGCPATLVVTVNTPANINGPLELCQGSTVTLTDATPGVTWSSSNTGVATIDPGTGVVTGIGGGTSIITATSPLGCTISVVVTVDPLPAAISGSMSICLGLTNCLTDATPGGSWSSSNSAIASVSSTGCVTGAGTGTATITYTLPTGCLITADVTVNPLPTAILGTLSFCQGTFSTLTDATPGGTWSSSTPAIAPITAGGTVSGALPGTATITYTLGTGCIATAVVTVYPLAPITGNLDVCFPGGGNILSDAATGGVWTSGNTSVANIGSSSGLVTGVALGTADITYTLPFGCIATAVVTIDPLPGPVGGILSVCVGYTTPLNAAPGGGTWSSSTPVVAIIDAVTGVVTGVSNGTSTITYTLPTGCTSTAVVTVNPIAVITGPTEVCENSDITLFDATPGGTWTSSSTGVATIDPFGNVHGVAAGTTTISYTLASGCAATVIITVNPLPAPISGNLNVCAWGGTTTLTDATAGGVWSATGVTIDNPSGLVTGFAVVPATVTYTLPTGCQVTAIVTVNPLPAPITGNTTVCVGFTTTLSDVDPGGTWTSVTTSVATVGSTTGVVLGVATGFSQIIYTLPTGCSESTTVNVLPVPNVITGTTVVCEGSVTSLTDATAGGTWSSSNTGIATVDASGNVNGVSGGTATITYTIPNGCFTSVTVTVNPLPAPITGPNTVCMGGTIALNDITPGGVWSSTNTAIGTVDITGNVTGITFGTTTISYTLPGTGCAATHIVTVNPLYPINGNVPFCVGQSITLTDTATGGTWTSVNPGIASVDPISGVVTGTGPAGGTTTIVYTLATGCTTNVIVTVNPAPLGITGVLTVCAGQTTNLTDATVGGNWSSSNPTVASVGATGIVLGVDALGGTATITYQIGSSCFVTTTVTVYPLSPIIGNASICLGQTNSLSDATPGGTWSAVNPGVVAIDASGNATGIFVDTTTIIYTTSTGCQATIVATVNPFAQITGGNTQLCVGNTITLGDAATGGIWTSSSPGIASIGSLTGVVTGGPGTGTVTITYTLPTGCVAYTTLTVNSLAAITGPTSVCVGSTITLSNVTAGGTWSSSNPLIGSVDPVTGIVTGVASGTTIISYNYSPNCWAIYPIVVNPMSPILGTLALCPGICTTLSDTTVGGTWASSDITVATIGSTTGVICALVSGTAIITYTVPTGCSATAVVTVDVVLPLTGTPGICLGGTTSLTDAMTGGTWSSSNTGVATVDGFGLVTSVSVGTSNITYTLPTGCVAVLTVTVNPNPAPITGPTHVCAYGGTIQLSDATPGGVWSSTDVTIGSTGIVTGQVPGSGTVTYQLPTGCAAYYSVTTDPLPTPINGNLVVCQGLTTTLSDLTPGGSWSSSDQAIGTIGSGTGIVTGIAPGTTVVTYTLPTGCYVDTIITVNPNPLPINGTPAVCVGLTTTLTDATGGGVWTSSNPSIASIGSSSGIVSGIAPGTVTITYTLLTGCINTIVVTVNPNPTAILGASSVCVGQSITLTDATPGGTWSSTDLTVTVGASTGIITGSNPGTATITYMLSTGCITTTVITVNALSPITGTASVCAGLTTALSDATPGGTWSSSVPGIGTVDAAGIVTGIAPGTTTISYILPSGCTTTLVVTVYPLPAAISGNLTVCVGQTTTLSDGVGGGTWTSSDIFVATVGSLTGVVTGVAPGTATITYALGTGCLVTAVVTVNPLAPISGATNLCQTQTTTLSDAVPGGTWSSSVPAVATIDAFGNITGVGVGTSVISYVTSAGCITTVVVTVNPLGLINGTTSLCIGTCSVFTDAVLGGTWSSSNPAVATAVAATGTICGVSAGTTIISYTMPSGCTATLIVTVAALSPITGPSTVCQGDSIALTDATPGGVWSSSNTTTATVSSTGEVIAGNSGTVIISYSYGPGCVSIKAITVYPVTPILGNLHVCQGFTTALSDSTLGGTWSIAPPLWPIAVINAAGVVTGLGVGGSTATVTYTLPTGCIATAIVTVEATSPIQGTDSVCVGLTTALTDATAGVTWTSSNTAVATIDFVTGLVTGISAGTTIITATSPFGCTDTIVIRVNPLPSAILGTPVVCEGLTITLSDLTPSGSWSSSDPAIASVGSGTGVVTGVLAGTAIITYMLPTGCITTIIVTVNPVPAPITGNLVVCEGSSTALSDATPGGIWSSGDLAVGSIDAFGVVTGISAGTTEITYTLGTGCLATAIVTVNPLPNPINGNPHVCIGTTVCFSDATPGGTWSSSDPAVGSIDIITGCVTGLTLGTTTITYNLIATGCLVVRTVTVDPLPLPITGPNQVCVGSSIQLTDATPGGTWSSSDTSRETIGLGTGVATGISAGVVTDTYTIFATGCFVTTTVTVNPLPSPINGNFSVCLGTTNTLTDADPLGTWTSSDPTVAPIDTVTGVVSGLVVGTAIITYTLPTGCEITQEVTVNPLPDTIRGSVPICIGASITLTDATPGGTWVSSLVDTATINDTSGVVVGIHSGTTTITYTITNTGCIATAIVTVNPTPNIITGNNTVCLHDSVMLSDASHGGTWTSLDPTIASVSPLAVDTAAWIIGNSPGGTIITYTLPTGCFITDSITVFPLPPAITGPGVVCVGSTITLSDSSVGGTWSSNHTDTASINSVTGIVTGVRAGTATITYTSNQGCTVTTVITVNPVPTAILGSHRVCDGFTRTLSDVSPGGVWSASNTSITTIGSATGVVTAISPGTDTIYYTFPTTGCFVQFTFTVDPIPVISVTRLPNAQLCLGDSVILIASGAATPGGTLGQYTWTPPTSLSATTGSTVTANPIFTTIYTVTGTTQYGCSSQATVNVIVDSLLLNIHITGRDSICAGEADTLIASGFNGSLFAWSPAVGLSCLICDTTISRVITTTTYTATAVDSFGCHWSTSFTVTVNPLPIVKVSPNPTYVCRGDSTRLIATGASTYTWFPHAFLSCYTCDTVWASDTQNLVYNVIGTSIHGCRDSVLVPVSVLDTTRNTISNDTIICLGRCAQLIATSTSVDGSHPEYYLWYPSAGLSDPNSPVPVACPDTTTEYSVIIKENACFTDTQRVIVYVQPQPAITISQSVLVSAGTSVQLTASISNEVLLADYIWTPGYGLSCERCFAPVATPTASTTYTFTATSNYGCSSNASVTINLFCDGSQVFIPNTFTPNGDGANDRFYISAHGITSIVRFSIYNRWGELVFQSLNSQPNDPGAGWDGSYKGMMLEPDVFVYVAEVICEIGEQPFSFKGDVSIVR